MKKVDVRDSNLELLRIFAIFMIIIHHLFYHCINVQVLNNFSNINSFLFYKRLFLTDFGALIGKVGNVIFILISGYFLCNQPTFNVGKQIKKIIMQLIYVSFLLIFGSVIYTLFIHKGDGNILLLNIINYNEWWFVGYYILILIMGYLFLSRYIQSMNQSQYRNLVLSLFAVISLSFSRDFFNGFSAKLPILLTGIFLYCLGGYIRKYNIFDCYKTVTIILMMLLVVGLVAFSYRNNVYNQTNRYSNLIIAKSIVYGEYSIVAISLGVCIFELFRRLKIKRSIIINFIAKSCFIVYLIHDNSFAKYLYNLFNWCDLYKNNLLLFILLVLGVAIFIFIIGLFAYILYSFICHLISKKRVQSLFLRHN